MSEPIAVALAGALVALVAAVLTAIVGAIVTTNVEAKRRREERRAAALQELRQRAAEVFVQIFAIQHELEWLTWHAEHNPEAVGKNMVHDYNANVHSAYPKLLGAMGAVASLSEELYSHLLPLSEEIYSLESEVAVAATMISDPAKRADTISSLKALSRDTRTLYKSLPEGFAEAMKRAHAIDWKPVGGETQ